MINDTHTYSVSAYHPQYANTPDHGTSHMAVLAEDGAAVSVTSTINTE